MTGPRPRDPKTPETPEAVERLDLAPQALSASLARRLIRQFAARHSLAGEARSVWSRSHSDPAPRRARDLPGAVAGRSVARGAQALGASCQTPSSILALRWLRLAR
jgi:hypothetical protein